MFTHLVWHSHLSTITLAYSRYLLLDRIITLSGGLQSRTSMLAVSHVTALITLDANIAASPLPGCFSSALLLNMHSVTSFVIAYFW
jgi:hypothetical protein